MKGRKTGGRKKGTPNKRTLDIRGKAGRYGPQALEYLVSVMQDPSEDTKHRLAASNAILDRAYGRPTQMVAGDPDNPVLPDRVEIRIVSP